MGWGKHTLILIAALALPAALSAQPVDNRSGSNTAADKGQPDATSEAAVRELRDIRGAIETSGANTYSKEEREHAQADLEAQEKSADWTKYTGIFALTGVIASIIGVGLIYATFQQTLKQAAEIKDSVGAAKRSATAMEGVAGSMAVNAQKIIESVEHQRTLGRMQMRAYVSVGLDEKPFFQDKNYNFIARPMLTNTGHTPARKLRLRVTASIEPCPLPRAFAFDVPDPRDEYGILMPHQDGRMLCRYPDRVSEDMVPSIMAGNGSAFYVWGIVSYEDVFGEPHETRFAQMYAWVRTDEVREDGIVPIVSDGQFLSMHNEAD